MGHDADMELISGIGGLYHCCSRHRLLRLLNLDLTQTGVLQANVDHRISS